MKRHVVDSSSEFFWITEDRATLRAYSDESEQQEIEQASRAAFEGFWQPVPPEEAGHRVKIFIDPTDARSKRGGAMLRAELDTQVFGDVANYPRFVREHEPGIMTDATTRCGAMALSLEIAREVCADSDFAKKL